MLKAIHLTALLTLTLTGVLAGCSDDAPTTNDQLGQLESQLTQWNGKRPSKYVVLTRGTGFAPPACVLAAVEGDAVVAARRSPLGARTPFTEASPAEVQEPLAEISEEARSAIRSAGCAATTLEFDPARGFLASYSIECHEESSGRKVECFAPDTLDLSACSNAKP